MFGGVKAREEVLVTAVALNGTHLLLLPASIGADSVSRPEQAVDLCRRIL